MKHVASLFSRPERLPFFLKLSLPIIIFCALAAVGMMPHIAASSQPSGPARQNMHTLAGDTCATATVINGAALNFFDNASTIGAGNDIDPGAGGCAPGPGGGRVFSF